MQTTKQLSLFSSDLDAKANERSAFSDPSFAANKLLPVHRWVPWIAGFSGNFVREIIDAKMPAQGTVLDPFAGVGTTLIEAIFMGYKAIGFEINPYAALACRVKANAHRLDSEQIDRELDRLRQFYADAIADSYHPISKPPSGFKTRKEFYSPAVLRKVLIIQDFIRQLNQPEIQEVFQLAFASTMVSYSNYSYEPSLGTRSAAGKKDIIDFPVLEAAIDKLRTIAIDVAWLVKNMRSEAATAKVIEASFLTCSQSYQQASVDLAITSPPYLNNYHYIRNTRPQLYWLGFALEPKDTKVLEHQNLGKYWQTVRELDAVQLNFPNPPQELLEQLAYLRTQNLEKGIYGGNGWANYAASYFNDCYQFIQGLRHMLKPGGLAYIAIGNSILQGEMIPTDRYLGQIAERSGLELIDISTPRDSRVGSSIIQSSVRVAKADKAHKLYESIVELRQPKWS